jgi:threonine/homoserine/homoserine lactone efflux protein
VPIQEALLKMSMYVALVLILPGPTNTLLLSSGLKVGLRGTWPLMVAEALGYSVAISVWGFLLYAFAADRPWLYDMVKLASSVYILYLAFRMWAYSLVLQDVSIAPVNSRDVFVATLLNPKALLFSSTVFPREAFTSAHYFAWALFVFLVVLAPIGMGWSSLGGLLTSQRAWVDRTPTLLRGASLVLLGFASALLYSIKNP